MRPDDEAALVATPRCRFNGVKLAGGRKGSKRPRLVPVQSPAAISDILFNVGYRLCNYWYTFLTVRPNSCVVVGEIGGCVGGVNKSRKGEGRSAPYHESTTHLGKNYVPPPPTKRMYFQTSFQQAWLKNENIYYRCVAITKFTIRN
jgi:hypothetical protein